MFVLVKEEGIASKTMRTKECVVKSSTVVRHGLKLTAMCGKRKLR